MGLSLARASDRTTNGRVPDRHRALSIVTAPMFSGHYQGYRLQTYDIAFELFAAAFAGGVSDDKQLSAFEAAAKRSGRVADLIALHEQAAPQRPSLHGRIRKLKQSLR